MKFESKICPKCKFKNESNTKFCIKCGMKFSENRCKYCGEQLLDGDNYCTKCGKAVSDESSIINHDIEKEDAFPKHIDKKEKSELKIHMDSERIYEAEEVVSEEVKKYFNKPSSL